MANSYCKRFHRFIIRFYGKPIDIALLLIQKMINREVAFVIMLVSSVIIGMICKLLGPFRYKKEILSLIGIIQLWWFCTWDIFHLLLMTGVGITLIKVVK